jgi:hypothetical protein
MACCQIVSALLTKTFIHVQRLDDLDDQYVNVNLDDGDFSCAEESLMSPPRALDLKTLKLEWPRKRDKPKILFSNYYKEIMLWNIR